MSLFSPLWNIVCIIIVIIIEYESFSVPILTMLVKWAENQAKSLKTIKPIKQIVNISIYMAPLCLHLGAYMPTLPPKLSIRKKIPPWVNLCEYKIAIVLQGLSEKKCA